MGCCGSAPAAPENIIPDPGPTEPCVFTLKSMGMMSSDYIAYQGEDTDDAEKRWQFVNKTGSLFGGDAVIAIENFVRGGNPDKPSEGEIGWTCKFNSTPKFQKQFKSPSSDFSRFTSWMTGGLIDMDGEEPDDAIYFKRAGRDMNDGGNRRVMKWKMDTSAQITPGPNRTQDAYSEGFSLDVFARGTSIADYDWEHDDDGGHWSKKEAEFVDMLNFRLTNKNEGTVIAEWAVKGDLEEREMVSMENAIFNMDINGGWFSAKPCIKTTEGWDPLLALMAGYLCAFEYSPKEIKEDLNSDFPQDPGQCTGW